MRTRTIRAWAVVAPLSLLLAAIVTGFWWLEMAAGLAVLAGVVTVVWLDGLRERGMPRRR